MQKKTKFQEWLESDSYMYFVADEGRATRTTFIKVAKNDDFDYLFSQTYYDGSHIERDYHLWRNHNNCHGLLCKVDGAEINQVYNGIIFPEYDHTGSSLITVELTFYDNTEYLYLPDDDWAIVKAVSRLGAESVDYCKCVISDICTDVGGTKKMLEGVLEYEDLFAVNKVASYINNADMDLHKLQALIKYAEAEDSTTICVLADRIDDFTFIEDIDSDEDVGRYFVENDEDFSVSAELEDFIKYDELGEHLREESD